MEYLEFLFVPIVGGIIGYFTNWLAIKMLFHPHEEMRIFGKRVPFTPGVIPKNKGQIASSVARVVNEYLVTPESLMATIKQAEVDDIIDTAINDMKIKLYQNDNSIERYLKDYRFDNFLNNANDYILEIGKSRKFKEYISEILCDKIRQILSQTYVKDLARKSHALLSQYISLNGERVFSKEELSGFSEKTIAYLKTGIESEERSLNEIIPENINLEIENLIHKFLPEISFALAKTIEENQVLNEKLEMITKKIVDDTVGSLVGAFIYKKIYSSIRENALGYLTNAENLQIFSENLSLKLREFFDNNPSEIIKMINKKFDTKEFLNEKAAVFIENNHLKITEFLLDFLSEKIENLNCINLYDLINKIYPKADFALKETVDYQIDKFINENAETIVKQGIDKSFAFVLNIKIKQIAEKIGENGFDKLKETIKAHKHIAIDKGAEILTSRMNISQMVEDKINASDAKLIESVTLEIVSRELNYITLMGGVLGFIIGFVPAIINMF